MTAVTEYLAEIQQKYGDAVALRPAQTNSYPEKIPAPLAEFYALYSSAEFPFGHIETPDEAVRCSEVEEPFRSERAFHFGADEYFAFWLCRMQPVSGEPAFTSWDHDADDEIEYAFDDLEQLLRFAEKEYIDSQMYLRSQ